MLQVGAFLARVHSLKIRTLVDADLGVLDAVVSKDDQDGIAALLSLDQDHISTEELKLLHGGGRKGQD